MGMSSQSVLSALRRPVGKEMSVPGSKADLTARKSDFRFSNRPVGVKRFTD